MRSDGWLFWTPEEIQGPGTFSVDVISQDLVGGPESRVALKFTVLEANLRPVLASIPNAVLLEGTPLQLHISATDVDLPVQPLTFRQVSGPSGLSVSADGLLYWVPSEDPGAGESSVAGGCQRWRGDRDQSIHRPGS